MCRAVMSFEEIALFFSARIKSLSSSTSLSLCERYLRCSSVSWREMFYSLRRWSSWVSTCLAR
jgi:hypothetical protein